MKRLYHRKRNLWLKMNFDQLKSIFECTERYGGYTFF